MKTLHFRAVHAFEHVDVRELARRAEGWLASAPATVRLSGDGIAVCLRYGVVTFVDATDAERDGFLAFLADLGCSPREHPHHVEELEVTVDAEAGDAVGGRAPTLADASIQRIQLVGEVLARSVALDRYAQTLDEVATASEPLARELAADGRSRRSPRALLKQMGAALVTRQALVGRATVTEKPELLWERPELERLYHQSMDEFEIEERNAALEAKLGLITETARTALDLIHHTKTLRVEWYIVLLIVFEIGWSIWTH